MQEPKKPIDERKKYHEKNKQNIYSKDYIPDANVLFVFNGIQSTTDPHFQQHRHFSFDTKESIKFTSTFSFHFNATCQIELLASTFSTEEPQHHFHF